MRDPGAEECNEQRFKVRKVLLHPRFSMHDISNDVALLWIVSEYGQPSRFSDYVQPVCLPDPRRKGGGILLACLLLVRVSPSLKLLSESKF